MDETRIRCPICTEQTIPYYSSPYCKKIGLEPVHWCESCGRCLLSAKKMSDVNTDTPQGVFASLGKVGKLLR